MELINIQNQLIKMKNKNRKQKRNGFCTEFELSKKTDNYFCCNKKEIMVALTQKLLKSFRDIWSRVSMLKSSRNQFKTIKKTYFGLIRSMKMFAHQFSKFTKITYQIFVVIEAVRIYHIWKQETYQKREFPCWLVFFHFILHFPTQRN